MARRRDYAAEYRARKAANPNYNKDRYWRPLAQQRIIDAQFSIWYGQDPRDVEALADDVGWEALAKGLAYKREMEDAYQNGQYARAHRLYEQRDTDLPEWFWHYHKWDI